MAEFPIKDKQDMQYFLNHITNQWNQVEEVKYEKLNLYYTVLFRTTHILPKKISFEKYQMEAIYGLFKDLNFFVNMACTITKCMKNFRMLR